MPSSGLSKISEKSEYSGGRVGFGFDLSASLASLVAMFTFRISALLGHLTKEAWRMVSQAQAFTAWTVKGSGSS